MTNSGNVLDTKVKNQSASHAVLAAIELIRIDLKNLRRQVSNPLLVGMVVVILIGCILTLGMFHFLVSAHAPFHEVSNPKFGLGGYLPLLFYLCVLTSLLLCLRLPSYREDSIQNIVLVYRVPSNFLFSLSRVLAPVLLVCGVLMVFSLAYQAFATIDLGIEPRIVEPFEAWSLAFVLTNLTIAIFFWTSLGNLVAQIFRSNVTGFLVTATLLIVQAFASLMLPSNVASFTFGYSAADLYVSEITPDDWGITRLIYWFSVLGLSFAWIFATSIVLARTDPAKRSSYRAFVVILISISLVGQGSVHTHILKVANERQSWTHAYETATRTQDHRLSVKGIQGRVQIEPGSNLGLEFSYTLENTNIENQDSAANGNSLALNPGMKVRNLQCSNVELPYSHVNGILEFDMRMCEPNDDNKYEFFIEADGIPDPYYLSPFALQTAHSELRPRMARLMGQRTSIFTQDYVALTALSHWYPQALDEYSDTRTKASKNLIDLALAVDLPHDPWAVVTTGGQVHTPKNLSSNRLLLNGKFRSMGMLASDFHIEKQSFDDTDVNVLVHRRHEKKLAANKVLMDSLVRYVREAIYKLQQLEIDYPFEQFSIVEVPTFLTLLNRNWDVDTGLDSVLTFRESGPPFVRPSRWQNMMKKAQTEELSFLQEQVEYQLYLYWTNPIFRQSYEDVIVKAILANLDYSADRHSSLAELILEQFVQRLLESQNDLESENSRFDFGLANELSVESRVSIRYMFSRLRSYGPYDLREFQQDYLDSHVFWESIERSFLATKESATMSSVHEIGDSSRRERFRVVKLVELITAYVDEREVATIVTNVLNRSETEPIDLNLIIEVAQSTNVDLAPLFQNTLLQRELPGIYFSSARQAKNTTFQTESHRYSTVLDFRNGEDVPAYVMFEIAELGEHDPNLGGRAFTRTESFGPVKLAGNSSHQLRMNTRDQVGYIDANTFLSLNRGTIEIPITKVPSSALDTATLLAQDNWISIAATQWIPYSDENVVIVDDLDPGFEVHSGYSPSKTPSWVLGGELFRSLHPKRKELDNGLPSATYLLTHSGNWARSSWGAGWGRYRHTYVFAPTSIRPIQSVSFNADLDRAGRWNLFYHFPDSFWGGNYNITATVGQQEWDLSLESGERGSGWTELGTLYVEVPGKSQVTVNNDSSAEYVFADAIKWKYLD